MRPMSESMRAQKMVAIKQSFVLGWWQKSSICFPTYSIQVYVKDGTNSFSAATCTPASRYDYFAGGHFKTLAAATSGVAGGTKKQ